jgi:Flp pilus assembly protein TadD
MKSSLLLASVSLLLLAGCATQAPQSAASSTADVQPMDGGGGAYGYFLAGHAAVGRGDSRLATEYLAEAARLSGEAEVREDAFFSAVIAGDISRAAALAPQEGGSPAATRLARLVTAVEAMANGRGEASLAALSGEPVGYPYRAAAALLKPWAAAMAGDWATATAEPELKSDRLAYNLGSLARAELMEKGRRYAEAEAVLTTMSDQSDAGGVFLEAHGAFLERRGKTAEAVALYDKALTATPTDRRLKEARARAAARGAPPALPDLKSGAAQALVGAAAGAALMKQADLSLVYTRLALRLDPTEDEAWLLLGDTLAASGDQDSARAAYGKVPPKAAGFVEARTRIIWTYGEEEESGEALRLARDTVRLAPKSALARTTLADVLRANKLYAESAQTMDGVIADAGERADWRLYYLRALALDKAGRWPDAERDLQAALKLKPDAAETLNYLGYSWIERGQRLEEALGMINKALESQPDSGAIVDSLGWAHYRLGQYDKALPHLERAAQLEPADAEINSHLGDAYWRVGRRIEARFQWRKVLTTMSPTDEMKPVLEKKLQSGLDADPARVAGR